MDNTTTSDPTTPSTVSDPTPFPSGDANRPVAPAASARADAKASTFTADSVIRRVTRSAHDAVDSVSAKVSSVTEDLQGGIDKVGDTRDAWIESARDAIRQHPFAAVAGALVIGAALLSLRSSRAD